MEVASYSTRSAVRHPARLLHGGDGAVHAEELVVLADDLGAPRLMLREQREVLHQIQEPRAAAGAAQHHLKRHAAACFLYFLERNRMLAPEGGLPVIDNNTLASLTLFIAVSKPEEMETVKRVVVSILNRKGSA